MNFTCNDGYVLEGANDLICLNNVQYTAAPPRCIGESAAIPSDGLLRHACVIGVCPTFPIGPNVSCSPSCDGITAGKTITFSCKQGYTMVNHQASVALCRADRTWSISSSPVCKGEFVQ